MSNAEAYSIVGARRDNTHFANSPQTIANLQKKVLQVAVKGLQATFDEKEQLFCFTVKRTGAGSVVQEKKSYRYTIISLLGLNQYERFGGRSPIDVKRALNSLIEKTGTIDNIGNLGLLLWLASRVEAGRLPQLYTDLQVGAALAKYQDAIRGYTTEMAWFLTGVSSAALTLKDTSARWRIPAEQTYQLIKNNYSGKGIFGHLKKASIKGTLRGRIGCFADQVYPIYAFTKFARAYQNEEAAGIALECANTVCRLQGPYGQWWWHYDSSTGKMVGQYPVFGTHQNGMAPMALFAIGEAAGINFRPQIYKGLLWVDGNNELGVDMIDTTHNVIWRSFYRAKHKMNYDMLWSLLQLPEKKNGHDDIKVNYECRPYHLGWILYAFSPEKIA